MVVERKSDPRSGGLVGESVSDVREEAPEARREEHVERDPRRSEGGPSRTGDFLPVLPSHKIT